MPFVPIILIISLFIFLYCLFVLSKDDFLLLRKNVTLEQLFNLAFIGFFVGLFVARVAYVLEHLKPIYLNPLVFFLFPYFPGLSITGGIVGAASTIAVYSRQKRLPFGRIFDIFSLSFFFSWSMGLLLEFVAMWITAGHPSFSVLGSAVAVVVVFILYTWLFVTGKLKDGNVGYIGGASFVAVEFLSRMVVRGPKNFVTLSVEDILLIFLFLGFIALYIQQETLGGLYKSMRKK